MAEMTAAGKRMRLHSSDEVVLVALGDHVLLAGGVYCGRAHCWTRRGVMVTLCSEPGTGPKPERTPVTRPWHDGFVIAALECGDGDLEGILM